MGQYNNSTKTLSLAAGATGRVWAAPSGMPFNNVTVTVNTVSHMPVAQVTFEVLFGGYWTVAAPYTSGATHNGGTSQGAPAAIAAGLTLITGPISAFADRGDAAHVIVTDNGHGLADGDWVSISGTTNYNGVFEVSAKTANTFDIVDTWVANDATGIWGKYIGHSELIFEDASSFSINSPSAPPGQSAGGFPIAVEFVNSSAAAMVLEVNFACETIGTNV